MSNLQLGTILAQVPIKKRAVIDTDGMFAESIVLDSYDRNFANAQERFEWFSKHEQLADRVFQPLLSTQSSMARPLPFFGYDPQLRMVNGHSSKRFDLVHVGHNWWRWREVSSTLLPAIEKIRDRLGEISFIGMWWDSPPPWAEAINLGAAFHVDSDRLKRLKITTRPPVPYTEVISTMSQGRVNIMSQRPLLRRLRLLTAKYFEIFCADTIPVVMLDPDHAESVYGPAGRELALGDANAAEKIIDAVSNERKYGEIVSEVRHYLQTHHSYRQRLNELIAALGDKNR